jgi:hypothetical protein
MHVPPNLNVFMLNKIQEKQQSLINVNPICVIGATEDLIIEFRYASL